MTSKLNDQPTSQSNIDASDQPPISSSNNDITDQTTTPLDDKPLNKVMNTLDKLQVVL